MYQNLKLQIKNALLRQKLRKEQKKWLLPELSGYKTNVLIIDSKIPEFKKDSGSRRLTEIIRLLLKNEIGVVLMADRKEYRYQSEYISYFKQMGVVVYEPSIDESGSLVSREMFLKKVLPQIDLAWLHRPETFDKFEPLIRSVNSSAKIIFDMVDFHYLRFKRESELNNDPKAMRIAQKYLKMELENCNKADSIIVISDTEKNALKEFYPDESKTISVGNIHQSMQIESFPDYFKRKDLLFIGGFDHKPNLDCVKFLHDEIMPLVWAELPEVKINIVGSNPPESLFSYVSARFNVVGYVDSVEPYFLKSRIFVAPLRYGAGIKGKIGQSLEYHLPLVTTTIGAEGFDFGDFKENMVSDHAKEFAEQIVRIYQDEDLWQEISRNTFKVIEPYSEKEIELKILQLLKNN